MFCGSQTPKKQFLGYLITATLLLIQDIKKEKKTSPAALKQGRCKCLKIILFSCLYLAICPKMKAQMSADMILARMGINLLDTFSKPISLFSWNKRDSVFIPFQLYLSHAEIEYARLPTDSFVRSISAQWIYSDSIPKSGLCMISLFTDSISRAQYFKLKPVVFRKELFAEKPFFLNRFILPASGMMLALLLISGMFYFRSR